MQTIEELPIFVTLWDLVQEIQFNDQEDTITWRWTPTGQYTTKSAYEAQFAGTYTTVDADTIWKAHIEAKHKFFAWLLVQSKILIVDKMLARNWQCNTVCPLCDQEFEMAPHLCLQCSYAREVWFLVSTWMDGQVTTPTEDDQEVKDWWHGQLKY